MAQRPRKCPNCGGNAKITESRRLDHNVYRKFKCLKCNYVFYTKETISDDAWDVINTFHREYYRERRCNNG